MFGTQHKEKLLMITHFFVFTFTVSFSPHCLFQSNKGVLKRRVSLFLDSEVRKEKKGGGKESFNHLHGTFLCRDGRGEEQLLSTDLVRRAVLATSLTASLTD